MKAIILALLLGGPPAPKRCLLSCYSADYDRPADCLYELAARCLAGECVDGPRRTCRPLVVNLGPWTHFE